MMDKLKFVSFVVAGFVALSLFEYSFNQRENQVRSVHQGPSRQLLFNEVQFPTANPSGFTIQRPFPQAHFTHLLQPPSVQSNFQSFPRTFAIDIHTPGPVLQQSPFINYYQHVLPQKTFWRKPKSICAHEADDKQFFEKPDSNRSSPTPFIVINEARSGSSWLQEISQMHPGVKVQFELDLEYGPSALQCKQCHRPGNPDSKHPERLPPKLHPPLACGFTIFGSSNTVPSVSEVASYSHAKLVLLLRRNHVAHAISAYRHFQPRPVMAFGHTRREITVPWTWQQLDKEARDKEAAYDKLLSYAGTGRPTHLIFYEDMNARVEEVWAALQAFLGLPPVSVPGIREAESKSSSRPAVDYLDRLDEVQRLAAGSPWADMLRDRAYDERIDFGAEFARVCRRFAGSPLSWRGGGCG